MSSLDSRAGAGLYSDGRSRGGSALPVGAAGRSRGDAGSSIVEWGEGADGGGR